MDQTLSVYDRLQMLEGKRMGLMRALEADMDWVHVPHELGLSSAAAQEEVMSTADFLGVAEGKSFDEQVAALREIAKGNSLSGQPDGDPSPEPPKPDPAPAPIPPVAKKPRKPKRKKIKKPKKAAKKVKPPKKARSKKRAAKVAKRKPHKKKAAPAKKRSKVLRKKSGIKLAKRARKQPRPVGFTPSEWKENQAVMRMKIRDSLF